MNSALLNFTDAIAKRATSDGIRVNALCPDHIESDRLMVRIRTRAQNDGTSEDEAREMMRLEHRHYGTPQDIAATVAFLCSDQVSHIHSTTIIVDGGATPGI